MAGRSFLLPAILLGSLLAPGCSSGPDRPAPGDWDPSTVTPVVRRVSLDESSFRALLAGEIPRLPDAERPGGEEAPPEGPHVPRAVAGRSPRFEAFLRAHAPPDRRERDRPDASPGEVEVRTPHYRLVTDRGPEEAGRLARALEAFLLEAWRELARPFGAPRPDDPFDLIALGSPGRYRELVGSIQNAPTYVGRTRGIYDAASGLAVVVLGRSPPGAALLHEAAHQLIETIPEVDRLPPWWIEGVASYLETAVARPDGSVRLGAPHPLRLDRLARLLEEDEGDGDGGDDDGARPGVAGSVLDLGPRAFVGEDLATGNLHYALSWALVHGLLAEGADRFAEVTRRLVAGEDAAAVLGGPEEVDRRVREHARRLIAGRDADGAGDSDGTVDHEKGRLVPSGGAGGGP